MVKQACNILSPYITTFSHYKSKIYSAPVLLSFVHEFLITISRLWLHQNIMILHLHPFENVFLNVALVSHNLYFDNHIFHIYMAFLLCEFLHVSWELHYSWFCMDKHYNCKVFLPCVFSCVWWDCFASERPFCTVDTQILFLFQSVCSGMIHSILRFLRNWWVSGVPGTKTECEYIFMKLTYR